MPPKSKKTKKKGIPPLDEGDTSPTTVPSLPSDSSQPLSESYTYHSPTPTAAGPYILGVDEAGRGPVLGPLVYGVAYCPKAWKDELEGLGFNDSKVLSAATRSSLLKTLCSDPENLAWSVRVLSPQAISNGMLRNPPINLNRQSEQATISLIREVLQSGIQLTEVYVDALGSTDKYESYLSSLFPDISFTVTTKADSKFKIVGAASVAAKVTRDAWVEGWIFEETLPQNHIPIPGPSRYFANPTTTDENGKGKGKQLVKTWIDELGSGYPSDPNTKTWVKESLEPTFGFPSLVRFSWTTIKVVLDKDAHPVKWIDEGQEKLVKAFESATGRDKGRCAVAKDLSMKSVGMI